MKFSKIKKSVQKFSPIKLRLKKFYRVYSFPLIFLAFLTEIIISIILWYLSKTNDYKSSLLLAAQAGVTMVGVGAGIFIPFLINRNWGKEQERRTLAFALGLIWHEQQYNKYIVNNALKNLDIKAVLNMTGKDFVLALKVLHSKLNSVYDGLKILSLDSFTSAQSSGAIKTINNDDLLNSIIEGYESVKDVEFEILRLFGNLRKDKAMLIDAGIIAFSSSDEEFIKKNIQSELELTKKRLDKYNVSIDGCLNNVDKA